MGVTNNVNDVRHKGDDGSDGDDILPFKGSHQIIVAVGQRNVRAAFGALQDLLQVLDVLDGAAQDLHFGQTLARVVARPLLQQLERLVHL